MKLKDQMAVITGANQGLGLAIAEAFIREGASILICARDAEKLRHVEDRLRSSLPPSQAVLSVPTDVSVEADVARLQAFAMQHFGRVDILVNNAGIYGPKGLLEDLDFGEWSMAIRVNLLGVFLMCKYLLPQMKKNRHGKIINLSGGGATAPLPRISGYAASKAAVVRLTETLALECHGSGIDVNSIAPGPLNTRLLEEVLVAGPEVVGSEFYDKALKQKESGGVSLSEGAGLCVYLASRESDGISGKLISAVWDPWENFKEHKSDLQNSDVYTLRRIVPKDRGWQWE